MHQLKIRVQVVKEGFHNWPGAPDEVDFLRVRHRHLFYIYAEKPVYHDDRDVEFILFGRQIAAYLDETFGTPMELGASSCERLAVRLIEQFDLSACSVFEDDENGAIVVAPSAEG